MSNFNDQKTKENLELNKGKVSKFSQKGLYVKEDDQDWGSSGMNNIQDQSEISQ